MNNRYRLRVQIMITVVFGAKPNTVNHGGGANS